MVSPTRKGSHFQWPSPRFFRGSPKSQSWLRGSQKQWSGVWRGLPKGVLVPTTFRGDEKDISPEAIARVVKIRLQPSHYDQSILASNSRIDVHQDPSGLITLGPPVTAGHRWLDKMVIQTGHVGQVRDVKTRVRIVEDPEIWISGDQTVSHPFNLKMGLSEIPDGLLPNPPKQSCPLQDLVTDVGIFRPELFANTKVETEILAHLRVALEKILPRMGIRVFFEEQRPALRALGSVELKYNLRTSTTLYFETLSGNPWGVEFNNELRGRFRKWSRVPTVVTLDREGNHLKIEKGSFPAHSIVLDWLGFGFGYTQTFKMEIPEKGTYHVEYTAAPGFTELYVVNPQVREALLANFNPTGGLEKLHRIRLGTFTKLNPRDPQAKDHPLFLDFAPILKEIAKRAEREGYLASMQDLLDSFIENPIQRGRTSLLSQDLKGKPLNHRSPVFQMPDTKGAYPILRDLGFRGATDRLVRAMEESTPERFRSGFLLSVPEHLENFELNVVVVFDNLQTILNPAGQVNAFKIVTKSIIHKARGYIVYHRQPGGFVKTVYDIHLIRLPHTGFEGIEVAHIYPLTEQEDRPDMSGVTEVARIPGISPERLDLYLQEELKSQYDLFGTFLVGLHGKPKAQGTFVTGDILQNSLVEMANQGALFMHPQFAQFFDRWFKPSDPNGDALVGS